MSKLTAVAVKAALATPGTYQDGSGLFLKVDKRGGASWTLRLQRESPAIPRAPANTRSTSISLPSAISSNAALANSSSSAVSPHASKKPPETISPSSPSQQPSYA